MTGTSNRDKELNGIQYKFNSNPLSMGKEIIALRKILINNDLASIDKYGRFKLPNLK